MSLFENVRDDGDNISFSDLKQGADLELKISLLRFLLPSWVSHPMPGENEFKYHWLISLQTSGFNITLWRRRKSQ